MLVEGVHFDLDYFSFEDAGYRAVAVNISDLASSGADPAFIFLSIGIPKGESLDSIRDIFRGIEGACLRWGAVLAGGDTNVADRLILSITAVGFGSMVMKRKGAKPGDKVCLTGALGYALSGYTAFVNRLDGFLESKKKFLRPEPDPLKGKILTSSGIRTCEDISDGLVRDLRNICTESGCGALLYAERIPVAEDLIELQKLGLIKDSLMEALSFGDDYELVFAADEEAVSKLKVAGIEFFIIGEFTGTGEIEILLDGQKKKLDGGYIHMF
jgi:thiamine-monophosphate kinase